MNSNPVNAIKVDYNIHYSVSVSTKTKSVKKHIEKTDKPDDKDKKIQELTAKLKEQNAKLNTQETQLKNQAVQLALLDTLSHHTPKRHQSTVQVPPLAPVRAVDSTQAFESSGLLSTNLVQWYGFLDVDFKPHADDVVTPK